MMGAKAWTRRVHDEQARWQQHCHDRLHDGAGAGGGVSLSQLFEQIDRLSETADERGQAILGEWYDYAEMIAPELAWRHF